MKPAENRILFKNVPLVCSSCYPETLSLFKPDVLPPVVMQNILSLLTGSESLTLKEYTFRETMGFNAFAARTQSAHHHLPSL